jgi:hypothetical protein
MAQESVASLAGSYDELILLDGTGYPSFSMLVNDSIDRASGDTVIICSDRCRPYHKDVRDLLSLLDEGYGIVGLYRFGFFGFRKYLISRIGYFDEQFIGGNYEDSDMLYRLKEANIAYYENEQVVYVSGISRWPAERVLQNQIYFNSKWETTGSTVKRLRVNPETTRQIPQADSVEFLPWEKSVVLSPSQRFKDLEFIK